eukprot:scaffold1461_cov253-Pinguiococcus_pyrenoidosus.AAC.9
MTNAVCPPKDSSLSVEADLHASAQRCGKSGRNRGSHRVVVHQCKCWGHSGGAKQIASLGLGGYPVAQDQNFPNTSVSSLSGCAERLLCPSASRTPTEMRPTSKACSISLLRRKNWALLYLELWRSTRMLRALLELNLLFPRVPRGSLELCNARVQVHPKPATSHPPELPALLDLVFLGLAVAV